MLVVAAYIPYSTSKSNITNCGGNKMRSKPFQGNMRFYFIYFYIQNKSSFRLNSIGYYFIF